MNSLTAEEIRQLQRRAAQLRLDIVEMIGVGMAGHLGGSCSLADIVSVLYFHTMRHDPQNPKWPQRDRFLLSKGHAALVQYAALGECGYFDRALFPTLKNLGSPLQGHPDIRKLPGLEANTGSLGQGVSLACGMAAGLRLDKNPARVYVAVGDGELAEGQLWEAFMAASHYRLDRLRVIVDHNGLQATGRTVERMNTEPLREKLEAFGLRVLHIDGHDVAAIAAAFDEADAVTGQPTAIIADTVKGCGIPFAEHVVGFHNGILSQEQVDEARGVLLEKVGEAQ